MRLLLTFIFLSFCFVSTNQAQVSLNARKKVQRSKKTPEIVLKPENNPISESNQFKIHQIDFTRFIKSALYQNAIQWNTRRKTKHQIRNPSDEN